eukprot:6055250-Lingulodinium_polyedra.AAC.1
MSQACRRGLAKMPRQVPRRCLKHGVAKVSQRRREKVFRTCSKRCCKGPTRCGRCRAGLAQVAAEVSRSCQKCSASAKVSQGAAKVPQRCCEGVAKVSQRCCILGRNRSIY